MRKSAVRVAVGVLPVFGDIWSLVMRRISFEVGGA